MRRSRRLIVVVALLVSCGLRSSQSRADEQGVRHRIDAAITVDPASSLLGDLALGDGSVATGSVSFAMRLSANSRELRFFGTLSPTFNDVKLSARTGNLVDQVRIWEEDRCHQRRGLPKVTVTQLRGAFAHGERSYSLNADMRHIGLRISGDELISGIKLPSGTDKIGPYYAVRATSKISKINVDLKLYAFPCNDGGAYSAPS